MDDDRTPDVDLRVTVNGKDLPLNRFSKYIIFRTVRSMVGAFRGAEGIEDDLSGRTEIVID